MLRAHVKATLARWVLRKRAEHPTTVDARDEATHFEQWQGRKRFGEDYTFVAAQVGLGIVVRLEWLPGRQSHRVWVTVLRAPERLALEAPQTQHDEGAASGSTFVLERGQKIVRGSDRDADPWQAGGLSLDCVEPLRQWGIRFVGRLRSVPATQPDVEVGRTGRLGERAGAQTVRASLDLAFVADGSPFCPGADDDPELLARRLGDATWDAKLLKTVRRDQNHGYTQTGRFEGTLAIDDELIPVRAPAVRLHTWGVRDWGASDEAFQCFAAWPDGRRVWVHRARFPFLTLEGGFVRDHGQNVAVTSLGATLERRPGRAPAHASLEMTHRDETTEVHLQMLRDTSFVVDGRGEVHLGLFCMPGGGHGIWGSQRRVLPRVRRG